MGEGKAARVAGAAVTLRSDTLPERGKGGAEARRGPSQGRGGAVPGRTPAQRGRRMASSLAEMAGLPRGKRTGPIHPSRPRKPAWGRCSRPPSASVSP